MTKKVYVKVPASIGNMGSGFDCAALSVRMYNEFYVERTKKTVIEFCKQPEEVSSKNVLSLFLQAFASTIRAAGEKVFPVKVKIENNIPFGRGFGSSAAVILAGVISALLFTGRKINKKEVLGISLPIEGHIDNLAASLYGGFTVGRADTLTVISVTPFPNLRVVAFIPKQGLSTIAARDILPDNIPISEAVHNISNIGLLCASFFLKKVSLLQFALEDKLHQPYRMKIIPHAKTLLIDKKPEFAIGGCLSGAGPSVVFFAEKKGAANLLVELKNIVKKEGWEGYVRLLYPGGKALWKVLK